MKIGMRLPSAGKLQDVVATARRIEAAGLDMAWLSDSPLNYREVWTVLGAIAVSTDRIEIGPMVTNFASRHISVTAGAARTVSEAVPGRFVIGIGAGDSAVGFDTLRPSTVAQMEEGVIRLRALMAGEPVAFGEFVAHLRDAHERPPIMVAAAGPRTLTMAGRVADGVIVTMGDFEQKIAKITAGAAEVGRPVPKIYATATCGLIDDPEVTLRRVKLGCMRIAQLEGTAAFEKAGFKIEGEFLSHKMGAHGDIGHSANVAEAAKALDHIISDDVARWYMKNRVIIGSEAEIEAGLRSLAEAGLDGVYLSHQEGSILPNELVDVLGPIVRSIRSDR